MRLNIGGTPNSSSAPRNTAAVKSQRTSLSLRAPGIGSDDERAMAWVYRAAGAG